MDNFYKKYLKYKSKYLNLKNNSNSLKGGLKPVSFRKVYGGYYAITYEGTIRYYVRHIGLGRVGRDGINIQATFKIIKNFINPEEIGGSIGIIEGDTKYKFYEINEHELELSANELQHKIDDIIPSIKAAVEAERIEQERRAAAVEAERAAAVEAERIEQERRAAVVEAAELGVVASRVIAGVAAPAPAEARTKDKQLEIVRRLNEDEKAAAIELITYRNKNNNAWNGELFQKFMNLRENRIFEEMVLTDRNIPRNEFDMFRRGRMNPTHLGSILQVPRYL